MILYLSLGTNLGNREENLLTAIQLLNAKFQKEAEAISTTIETKSWGFEGNDFLNCVVRYDIDLEPHQILNICKSIEKQMGRSDEPQFKDNKRIYHNRIIDIDILTYGDIKLNTKELTIPHPLMKERAFVMIPLKEIID